MGFFNFNKAPKALTGAALAGVVAATAAGGVEAAPEASLDLAQANVTQKKAEGGSQEMRLGGARYDKDTNTITIESKKEIGAPVAIPVQKMNFTPATPKFDPIKPIQ
ncbi:MAG: hypothetical protein JWN18_139 [Parcubacteria group bacterium]|nr:hypothetical protein [Parcubacteria group bacterium]